jgi:hypothetical protein
VAYFGGGMVLLAWLASAAGVPSPAGQNVTIRPVPDPPSLDALASDVQSQAVRLRQRLASAPAPKSPLRNPFSFDSRDVAKPRAPRPAPEPTTGVSLVESLVAELPLTLLGLAEKQTPDGPKRTAIVGGAADELFMVGDGDELAGRYRVVAIGADAVELKDLLTGATRRLVLR